MKIIEMLRGLSHGGWVPAETGNFHLYTLVIGSQTLHATGYAMGMQLDGATAHRRPRDRRGRLVYFGDGATSQGDVSEALVFAASYQTPQRLLPAEQPLGDLGAGRAPVAHAALSARDRVRHPERADRRQRRARQLRRHRAEPRRRPQRAGPALHRGAHLPHGRAHLERRPDASTATPTS